MNALPVPGQPPLAICTRFLLHNRQAPPLPAMELAASASASVCSAAYHHLSAPPAPGTDRGGGDSAQEETTTTRLDRRRRKRGGGGCAGLRRRCYAVLKQQRTRLYILRRCVTMLLCWHEHDLSD